MQSSILASLEARVAEHPWQTLGGAFLLGAWIGLDPPRAPRNPFARAVFAMIGSLAIRVVREVAIRDLAARAAQTLPERRTSSSGQRSDLSRSSGPELPHAGSTGGASESPDLRAR